MDQKIAVRPETQTVETSKVKLPCQMYLRSLCFIAAATADLRIEDQEEEALINRMVWIISLCFRYVC